MNLQSRAECVVLVSPGEPKLEQLASDIADMSPWLRRPPVRLRHPENAQVLIGRTIWIALPTWTEVNNSGFAVFKRAKGLSIEEIEGMIATNYHGIVYHTKAFLNSMLVRKSGHIVNTAVGGAANQGGGGGLLIAQAGTLIILHRRLQKQMMQPAGRTRRPSAGARAAQNGRSPSCRVQILSLTIRPHWGREAR